MAPALCVLGEGKAAPDWHAQRVHCSAASEGEQAQRGWAGGRADGSRGPCWQSGKTGGGLWALSMGRASPSCSVSDGP